MSRTFVAFAGAALLGAVTLVAQEKSSQPQSGAGAKTSDGKPVTFSGCLVFGSNDGSFALISATEKGSKDKTKVSLKVVPATPKLDLASQLTHAVEITGTLAAASGASDRPELTATKIKWVADYCG